MSNLLLYSQPTISGSFSGRPYISFKHILNNKRYRIFSGVEYGMGSTRGLQEKEIEFYFRTLLHEVTVRLNNGWNPEDTDTARKAPIKSYKALKLYDNELLAFVDKAAYSTKHKYTLKHFWKGLLQQEGERLVSNITPNMLHSYLLNRYASCNTSYNTALRYVKCLFNLLVQLEHIECSPAIILKKRKAEASMNIAFEKDELFSLMSFLKENDRTLYRVALLMFTTFLRPHQEIRLLKVNYFKWEEQLLVLPPRYTKNGKQVTIPLQQMVLEEFSYLKVKEKNDFVFGEVNPFYFSTRWGKHVKKAYPLKENQTLYSIRHTAAVEMYHKTKDVALIQRMMHHSSMEVTIGYLRSLNCNLAVATAEMYPSL